MRIAGIIVFRFKAYCLGGVSKIWVQGFVCMSVVKLESQNSRVSFLRVKCGPPNP